MAITKAIPTIWSARILEGFQASYIWGQLFSDISSEIEGEGNKINLSSISSGVTVKDYTRNADIDDPEIMTDTAQELNIDQEKYFNIYVDSVDRVQSKPDLLSHFTLQAGREIAKTVDTFAHSILAGSGTSAIGSDQSESTKNILPTTNDAGLEDFLDVLNDVVGNKLYGKNWPTEGTNLVLARDVATLLNKLFYHKGYGTGATGDTALASAVMSNLFGIQVMVDNNQLPVAAAAGRIMAFFANRECGYWANQIREVEPYRPEKRFGDAVKGLGVYGARMVDDSKRYAVLQAA